MQPRVIRSLRALIALLLVLLVVAQTAAVPIVATGFAERYREFAYLKVPGILAAVVLILCVQFVFVCVWMLLSLVQRERIFSPDAFRYVDLILAGVIVATAFVATALVVLLLAGATTPSISLLLVFGVVVGAGLSLLIVVLRGLLTQALQLQQDLSEVV